MENNTWFFLAVCPFCMFFFSQKTRSNPVKKTSEQCFSGKRKSAFQNSAIFEHFQEWPKRVGDVPTRGLSIGIIDKLLVY